MIKRAFRFLVMAAGLPSLVTAVAAGPAMSLQQTSQDGWRLAWSDDFNQPDGSAPDPANWGYDIGGNGWGNSELEYYTDRINNAHIEDGKLVIEAQREHFGGRNITSARLLTKGKWSWTCGKFEARIKIPRGQGIWPAFWMLGTNISSVGWPACGEIDIMENIGKEPGTVHGTVHGLDSGRDYNNGLGISGSVELPDGAALADDFHVFAVDCEPARITWLLDGHPYFSVTPASLPKNCRWVFDQPKFILLNLAIGGKWPGYPDAATTFPQQMIVDYVRVYSHAPVSKTTEQASLKNAN
jgi:beta-glucanase (GH16 family)